MAVPSPKVEPAEEEYSYSDYSYDESDTVQAKQIAFRQSKGSSSKDSNIFSSIFRSSKKLFDELSNAGMKSDSSLRRSERVIVSY